MQTYENSQMHLLTRILIKLHPDMNAVFWIYFLEDSELVVPAVSNSDNYFTIKELSQFKPQSKKFIYNIKLNIFEILEAFS